LWTGLKTYASDEELRALSDALLGRAVQLAAGPLPDLGFDDTDRQVLKYLDKPRKPDQLERAIGNRRLVRALLRLVTVIDKAKLVPAPQGIPIPKAAKVGGTGSFPAISQSTADLAETTPTPSPPQPTPTPPKPRIDAALIAEARALHGEIENKTHFEILGVTEQTPAADLRKAFTVLQKNVYRFAEEVSPRRVHRHQRRRGRASDPRALGADQRSVQRALEREVARRIHQPAQLPLQRRRPQDGAHP
jgi:hypothetical protein